MQHADYFVSTCRHVPERIVVIRSRSVGSCYLFHSTSRSYGWDNKPEGNSKEKKVVLLVGNLDSFKSRIRSEWSSISSIPQTSSRLWKVVLTWVRLSLRFRPSFPVCASR